MTRLFHQAKTVLHPVSDLATAKAVYAALLGVPPQTDESYYVGFEAAGQHKSRSRPIAVSDAAMEPVDYFAARARSTYRPTSAMSARPRSSDATHSQ